MTSSLNRMTMAAIGLILLLMLGAGGVSIWVSREQAVSLVRISEASQLLRNHMTADMMHDAIRADGLALLQASADGGHGLAEAGKALDEHAKTLRDDIAIDKTTEASATVRQAAGAIDAEVNDYIDMAGQIRSAAQTDPAKARALMPRFIERFEALEGKMSGVSDAIETHVEMVRAASVRASDTAEIAIMTAMGLSLVMVVLLGLLCRRYVVAPLATLVATIRRMTAGDFDVQLPATGRRDELGQLASATLQFRDQLAAAGRATSEQADMLVSSVGEALSRLAQGDLVSRIDADLTGPFARLKTDFNGAMDALQLTIAEVTAAAREITNGAGDISQASDDLSRRTEQQAASLEETAAALDEISSTVRRTAEDATRARATVAKARSEAEHSGEIVARAVEAMGGIERSSNEISEIIAVIDGIAFQTNLLALNAGVEAARAGDAGRGFAVVASEVRALAQRSADAAKDVKARVTASGQQVGAGVSLVGETGAALRRIVTQILEANQIVEAIASAAEQQASGLQQVNAAVGEMDGVTQQNAAMVEEATASARGLASEADGLSRQVARFRVSSAQDTDITQQYRNAPPAHRLAA
jgi:methyl-accepting chemotaxis protein